MSSAAGSRFATCCAQEPRQSVVRELAHAYAATSSTSAALPLCVFRWLRAPGWSCSRWTDARALPLVNTETSDASKRLPGSAPCPCPRGPSRSGRTSAYQRKWRLLLPGTKWNTQAHENGAIAKDTLTSSKILDGSDGKKTEHLKNGIAARFQHAQGKNLGIYITRSKTPHAFGR